MNYLVNTCQEEPHIQYNGYISSVIHVLVGQDMAIICTIQYMYNMVLVF